VQGYITKLFPISFTRGPHACRHPARLGETPTFISGPPILHYIPRVPKEVVLKPVCRMRYARPILGGCADGENMSIEPGPNAARRSDLDGADSSYGIAVDGERK